MEIHVATSLFYRPAWKAAAGTAGTVKQKLCPQSQHTGYESRHKIFSQIEHFRAEQALASRTATNRAAKRQPIQ